MGKVTTYRVTLSPRSAPLLTPDERSIAVLPFSNLSDGIPEDILTRLSKIAGIASYIRSRGHSVSQPPNPSIAKSPNQTIS
jgi:TolB-like protein